MNRASNRPVARVVAERRERAILALQAAAFATAGAVLLVVLSIAHP